MTITVSYDNVNCIVGCPDASPGKGTTLQWTNDRTVSSFSISNISPESAFSQLPTAQNNWTGILNANFLGGVSYEIGVTPTTPGKCTVSQRQKAPQITVSAPMPAAKY